MKKANAAAGGHAARGFTILLAALTLAALLRAAIGPVATDGGTTLTLALPRAEVLSLRLSAIASAALLGAALGLSGLALQILLRNPLASPFVLGVSSGAGFGVSLVLAAAYATGLPALAFGGEFGGAVAGALLTLALVAWLGRARGGGSDPTTLVLAGVITGSVFSAGSMLVEQLVPFGLRGDLLSWMAGRIPELPSRASLATLAVLVAAGVTLLATRARALDVSMLSDEEALTSGVHLRRLRAELFITGGVLAAAAVAYAGPIGFVGLVGPHIARRLVGEHHARLVPASAIAGAALLLGADAARQCIDLGTGRLPVGVVTALVGGPAFLWILRRHAWTR
jgi:iron complex transport system permease protein